MLICFLGNYQNNIRRSRLGSASELQRSAVLTILKQLHPKGILEKKSVFLFVFTFSWATVVPLSPIPYKKRKLSCFAFALHSGVKEIARVFPLPISDYVF